MSEEPRGYRGAGFELLEKNKLSVGDRVKVATHNGDLEGVIMPRYESASDDYIVIKLKSGYNAGVQIGKIKSITRLPKTEVDLTPAGVSSTVTGRQDLPGIALISTGGTIASKIDYRTGGVHSALSASELYASVPELASNASVDPEVLMSEYSENLKPQHWAAIANKVAEKVRTGRYAGIVVSHGTDTMHYTAAALSFALQNLSIPVVLVGAQRSSDRPSSDATLNLVGATVFAAKSKVSGIFVAMHAGISDDLVACHVGTRVRKNHTSRRDAFESIDRTPVALIRDGEVQMQEKSGIKLPARNERAQDLVLQSDFDERVALLKYHPGFNPRFIDHAVESGLRAIIIEGTGLGHVNKDSIPALRNAINKGMMVCMTSQCIWGRVRMTVYDTGRDLLGIGVTPLSDMISETATVKAMWALANSKNLEAAKALMQRNIANEISASIPI